MEVQKTQFASSYKDKRYYFCSKSCKDSFDKEPEKFAK